MNFCRRFIILKKADTKYPVGTPTEFRKHFPWSRALWTQSSLTQRVSFFCSLRKEGSTRVPRHQRLCFPNLISFLTKVSQLRRGMAYQILPLSRSFHRIFLHFCAFLLGSSPPSVVSRDAASVPASVSRGPYSGGPRRAMEGAHDLLNDFQGEAKLNGMVRPLP